MDGLAAMNELLSPGEDIKAHPVHELMSRRAITTEESCPVSTIARTLVTNRVHRLVIVREDRPIGIVSVGDILRTLGDYTPT